MLLRALALSDMHLTRTCRNSTLKKLNAEKAKGDLIVVVSDNMSWADFGLGSAGVSKGRATEMANQWARFKARNPQAKLTLIDLQPYASTQVQDDADVLNVGGFSDRVFEIVASFAKGELGGWVDVIRAIELVSA